MITEERVRQIAEGLLADDTHFIVDIAVSLGNIIAIEVDNDEAIKISELAELNRAIRDKLEAEGEDVELRVSSPGAGKPFKVERQFKKHVGRPVVVELNDGKKLVGLLEEWNDSGLGLRIERPSKVKGRLPKLDEDLTKVEVEKIKATKARVAFK